MSHRPAPLFRAAVALGALLLAAAAPPPQQQVIDAATRTVRALHTKLGRGVAPLLRRATAALIAPHGNTADAVLLLHARDGWSEPAFFNATALPGKTPTVLLIMSEPALDDILRQRGLALDGPGALTLAPITAATPADLLLWPGKTAKLDPNGFAQDDAADAAWYGRPRNAPEIVGWTQPDLRSSALRAALAK